jgi:5-methylcytosine-specific restriction protein A
MQVCSTSGCPNLVEGKGKCSPCSIADDRRRPNATARGYDRRWRRTRRRYLASHPTCEDKSGCGAKATDVHHLDGLGPTGPHGHDPANLQALCHPHHSALTVRDQGGFAAV